MVYILHTVSIHRLSSLWLSVAKGNQKDGDGGRSRHDDEDDERPSLDVSLDPVITLRSKSLKEFTKAYTSENDEY